MTAVSAFATALQHTMGLNPDSVGLPIVESALKARLAAGKFKDLGAYWDYLLASRTEMQELIDAAIVPETWFFRDREAFAALAEEAQAQRLRSHPDRRLRLLSLPCASGEEPYSIAMSLLAASFPADRFRIDGIDISTRMLERARTAVYGKNSFRGAELAFRERFFVPAGTEYTLAPEVRAQVDFQRGNLLDPEFLRHAPAYDYVFCRNLLIYFDTATQLRTVEVLKRLLTADGTLFVGPSESGLFLNHDFVSAQLPRAFAFRRRPRIAPAARASAAAPHEIARALAPRAAPPCRKPVVRRTGAAGSGAPLTPAAANKPAIDEIASLADRGLLAEAIDRGEAFLARHGPSARVYQLIGLALDASGRQPDAEQYYRKVLYLDPTHREAIVHLAFLLERKGDAVGAQRLHRRARRALHGERS